MINTCYFCEKKCVKDDYCHGCKQYICNDCSINCSLTGNHNVEDHLEEEEEFEDEDENID